MITRCLGKECDKIVQCKRYIKKKQQLKPYYTEPPIKNGICEEFIKV
jgi:hypothetical protein